MGLVASAFYLSQVVRRTQRADRVTFYGASIVCICFVVQQKFHNVIYISVYFPAVCVLVSLFLFQTIDKASPSHLAGRLRVLVVVFIGLHGLFWGTRTYSWIKCGMPNVRKEILEITNTLPSARRILVPVVFWESAIGRPTAFAMNTLPNTATNQRRTAYEASVYADLIKGDLVVFDRFQPYQPLYPLPHDSWILLKSYKHILPGRHQWGYDLTVWQKI